MTTVLGTGSDLGWQDNAKPAQLQQKIADKRAAMASAAAAPQAAPADANGGTVAAPVAAAPATAEAAAAPATAEAPTTAPAAAAAPDVNGAMSQTIAADEIARERALVLFNIHMKNSDDAVHTTPPKYDIAIREAHDAGTVIDDNRRYFSDAEANNLRATAGTQEQAATTLKGTFDAQETAKSAESRTEDRAVDRGPAQGGARSSRRCVDAGCEAFL